MRSATTATQFEVQKTVERHSKDGWESSGAFTTRDPIVIEGCHIGIEVASLALETARAWPKTSQDGPNAGRTS